MSTTNSHTEPTSAEPQIPETQIKPEVPASEQASAVTPTSTQEFIDGSIEVLKGEGEPITERAPFVPFVVVFSSYFLVLASLMAFAAFCLWLFVFRD